MCSLSERTETFPGVICGWYVGESPQSPGPFPSPHRALRMSAAVDLACCLTLWSRALLPVLLSAPGLPFSTDPVPSSPWLTSQGLPRVQSWNSSLLGTCLGLLPPCRFLDYRELPAWPGCPWPVAFGPVCWICQFALSLPQVPADSTPEPGLPGHHSRLQPEHAVAPSCGRFCSQYLSVSPQVDRQPTAAQN